jgi:hypothetical protein
MSCPAQALTAYHTQPDSRQESALLYPFILTSLCRAPSSMWVKDSWVPEMNILELNVRFLRNRFVLSRHRLTLSIHEIMAVADMFRALRYVDLLLRNPPPAVVEAFNSTGHQI